MSMLKENRPAHRTVDRWALALLLEVGAIHECEEHGWAKDRTDPHAREHALVVARQHPPPRIAPEAAVAAVTHVLESIGDVCPECRPTDMWRKSF
jgi:hypothetical protein